MISDDIFAQTHRKSHWQQLFRQLSHGVSHAGALIERTVGTVKHIQQQAGLATGKDEACVRAMLYLCTQQGAKKLWFAKNDPETSCHAASTGQ